MESVVRHIRERAKSACLSRGSGVIREDDGSHLRRSNGSRTFCGPLYDVLVREANSVPRREPDKSDNSLRLVYRPKPHDSG